MKVILLEDVKSLGKKGEIVNVNDGYARNYVLPKKLGVEANNKNMNEIKKEKQERKVVHLQIGEQHEYFGSIEQMFCKYVINLERFWPFWEKILTFLM